MGTLGAAFYTGNFHKWLCSPKVCAMLYVRPDMQERIHPLATSHLPCDFDSGQTPFRIEFQWIGTPDPTAALSVPRAGSTWPRCFPGASGGDAGQPRPGTRGQEADLRFARRGTAMPRLDGRVDGILRIALDRSPDPPMPDWVWMDPLQRRLLEEFRTEVPVSYIRRERLRLLRISAQLYNDISQYEYLAESLGRML